MRAPLIVNYGAGVDSTAMLVGLKARGVVPDLVIFADTGGEKPETYAYLDVIRGWLRAAGFPAVMPKADLERLAGAARPRLETACGDGADDPIGALTIRTKCPI